MSDISQWDPVDANNADVPPDGFPEQMPASALNDSSRAVMGGVRRHAEDGAFFDFGHSAMYVSPTMFQVPGDLSAVYLVGRRVRVVQTATVYGVIDSVAVSANTDVTVTLDVGALANEAMAVSVGPEPNAIGSFGSAASVDVGTGVGDVVQLVDVGGTPGFPAVDGSQLSGITSGWDLLAQITANADANTYFFDNAAWFAEFNHFRIEFDGLVPVSNAVDLWVRVSNDGGSSYISSASYRGLEHTLDGIADVLTNVGDGTRWGPAGQIANTAGYGVHGYVELRAMNQAGMGFFSDCVWRRSGVSNEISWTNSRGWMVGLAGPFNAFQVLVSSGLWASGGFRVFGIKRTF